MNVSQQTQLDGLQNFHCSASDSHGGVQKNYNERFSNVFIGLWNSVCRKSLNARVLEQKNIGKNNILEIQSYGT